MSLSQPDADAFYEQLLDAHEGLSREQSELLHARLILLLANEIGDPEVLRECVEAAARLPDTAPSVKSAGEHRPPTTRAG